VLKGFVILTLHATPVFPCLPGADSMKLSILKAPVVSAGPGAITCETLPVTITGASATGYDSLYWTHTGQGSLIGERTLTPTYLPGAGETGIILLTLTAYGKDACSDSMATALTEITIYPAITIDAGQDRLIPYGTKDTLSGSVNGGSGIFRYKWEPASLLTDSTSLNPVTIVLTADTNFILSVTDYLTGCLATDTVRIRIRKQPVNESDCIVIHNVITPNGDGLNDTWIIDCIENFPDNKVEIFNQWGVMVKSFTHYDNSTQVWKGTNFNDKPVPDATYFYVLTIKDQEPRMGWIFVRDGSR